MLLDEARIVEDCMPRLDQALLRIACHGLDQGLSVMIVYTWLDQALVRIVCGWLDRALLRIACGGIRDC